LVEISPNNYNNYLDLIKTKQQELAKSKREGIEKQAQLNSMLTKG
jgi:hypothetical protein